MSSVAVGGRVGAIQSGEGDTVRMFGYGVRLEDSVPPENVGGFNMGVPNITLKMDNGTLIYGCESWWGPEDKIREKVAGKEIVYVDPRRKEEADESVSD